MLLFTLTLKDFKSCLNTQSFLSTYFVHSKENSENININNSYENLRNKNNQQGKDQNRKKNEYEEDQFIKYLKIFIFFSLFVLLSFKIVFLLLF